MLSVPTFFPPQPQETGSKAFPIQIGYWKFPVPNTEYTNNLQITVWGRGYSLQ